MPQKIAERLLWAVDTLAVEASHHVLEIGCGTGVAAAVLCERLTEGKVTAIDRSQGMIDRAQEKYAAQIAAGRASFIAASLAEANFGSKQFDKIFAVNVNMFWQEAGRELTILKAHLALGGALYLFYQPPSTEKTQVIASKVKSHLEDNGFVVREVLFKELDAVLAVCIVAVPDAGNGYKSPFSA